MWSAISRLLSEQLGNAEITQRHALAGGDIHPTWQIRYGDPFILALRWQGDDRQHRADTLRRS